MQRSNFKNILRIVTIMVSCCVLFAGTAFAMQENNKAYNLGKIHSLSIDNVQLNAFKFSQKDELQDIFYGGAMEAAANQLRNVGLIKAGGADCRVAITLEKYSYGIKWHGPYATYVSERSKTTAKRKNKKTGKIEDVIVLHHSYKPEGAAGYMSPEGDVDVSIVVYDTWTNTEICRFTRHVKRDNDLFDSYTSILNDFFMYFDGLMDKYYKDYNKQLAKEEKEAAEEKAAKAKKEAKKAAKAKKGK